MLAARCAPAHALRVTADDLDPQGLLGGWADATFADQLLVEVVAISDDRMTPLEDTVIWVEAYGVSGPAGWVETSATDALGEVGITDGYYLDHRRSVIEWGASGAIEQIVVTLGQGVFIESAVLVALHMAGRVVARVRSEDDDPYLQEDEAEAWARTRVAIKYGVDADDLGVAAVGSRDDGSVSVALVGADGTRYDLRLRGLRAGVRVVECTRTLPEMPRG